MSTADTVDSHFASEVTESLGRHYDHYYVNKLMLSFDVEKWIQFKAGYYGQSSRAQLNRLFSEIRATRPPKHCLVIITTEILKDALFCSCCREFFSVRKTARDTDTTTNCMQKQCNRNNKICRAECESD